MVGSLHWITAHSPDSSGKTASVGNSYVHPLMDINDHRRKNERGACSCFRLSITVTVVNRYRTRRTHPPVTWMWFTALALSLAAYPPPRISGSSRISHHPVRNSSTAELRTSGSRTQEQTNPEEERTSSCLSGGGAQTSLQMALSLQEDCFAGASFRAEFLLQRDINIQKSS